MIKALSSGMKGALPLGKALEANSMYFFVLASLFPLALWSYVLYGVRALCLEVLALVCGVLFHTAAFIIKRFLLKRSGLLYDISPLVSCMLIVLTLPHNTPYYCIVIGCAAAIASKELTGGLGKNVINPALFGRVFLQLFFAKETALKLAFETDSERSGLASVLSGSIPERDLSDMILGRADGNLGEISVILLILCGIFLAVNRVINLRAPISYIVGAVVFSMLFAPDNVSYFHYICGQLFCGGTLFCALYFCCDPVTAPHTSVGKYVFGGACGAFTVLIRIFFSFEGAYIVVLFASLWVPLMDRFLRPDVFGGMKRAKPEKIKAIKAKKD